MQVKTVDDARALLVKRRVMTLAGEGTARVPSLASAIAGKPVRGSWWAHPLGKLIFKLSNELADDEDVLLTHLAGKVTFVHAKLWPAIYRVATDPTYLRTQLDSISPEASNLFEKVRKAGTLHITKDEKPAAEELEGLVIHTQEHGESGAHRTVLRDWRDWAPKAVVSAAKRITTERAEKQIAEALGWGASSLAPLPVVQSTPQKTSKPPVRRKRR